MAYRDEPSSKAQRLETILSSLHRTPVAVFDRDGTVQSVWMDPEDVSRYGFEGLTLEGMHVSEVIPPPAGQELEALLRQVYDSGETAEFARSFGRYWLDVHLSPLRGPSGETEGVIAVSRDITERKQAEETLRSSEEKLRAVLSGLHETPIAVIDEQGVIRSLWAPRTGDSRYGLGQKDAEGRRLHDLIDRKEADEVLAIVREVYATGEPRRDLRRFRLPAGEFVHDVSFAPVRGADGEVQAVLSVSRDVTDAERTKESLHEREQYLRKILASLEGMPIALMDRDGRVAAIFHGEEVERRYGLDREQTAGSLLGSFIPPDTADDFVRLIREVFDTGETRRVEKTISFPAGDATLDTHLSPIFDASGRVETVLWLSHDITERKRMETALRVSEKLYQTLADTASVGIYRMDRAGRFIYVNERWTQITGLSAAQSMGRGWMDALHPDDRVRAAARVERLRTGRSKRARERFDGRMVRPDGETRWVFVQTMPVIGDGAEIEGLVGTVTDVTDLKRAQTALLEHSDRLEALVGQRTAELERSHQELRRSERLAAIGTFAAGIAHQINNPVGGILLAAQFALDAGVDSPQVRTALSDIVEDCERCGRVVHNILRFAREDAWEKAPADLNAVVRTATEAAREYALDGGVRLEVELGERVPPVALNETAMREVVANLVHNAIEAGSERIVVRTEATSDGVCVAVEDDGRGISAHHRSRVFDPFYTTRRREGGTGLGLSIAHAIVVDHLGTFEVESEPGRGTTIKVNLPRTTSPPASARGATH